MPPTDADHYFQTDASIKTASRQQKKAQNNNGSPIRLQSKVLALLPDPKSSNHVYAALASGSVCHVSLEDNGAKHAYFTGPAAPVTSLALSVKQDILYSGCWDKSVWSWNTASRRPGTRFAKGGHTDFVKCVLCANVQGSEVLLSGGADAKIIVWNAITGVKIQSIDAHTSSVQALAIGYARDVFETAPEGENGDDQTDEPPEQSLALFSVSTSLMVHLLEPSSSSPSSLKISPFSVPPTLNSHDTTISSVLLASHSLYTCSLDHACSCVELPLRLLPDFKIDTPRESPTSFGHHDYVRAVALSLDGRYVFTAGRDEDIYVWSAASADLVGKWTGHHDEVMDLCIVGTQGKGGNERLLSSGIDGTIRRWEAGVMETEGWGKGWLKAGEEEVDESDREDEGEGKAGSEDKGAAVGLTAEEEQELAELMDSE